MNKMDHPEYECNRCNVKECMKCKAISPTSSSSIPVPCKRDFSTCVVCCKVFCYTHLEVLTQ